MKKLHALVLCAALVSAIATSAIAKPLHTIKLGHSDTTQNLLHVSLENFKKYVEDKSEGRLQIDLYAAEQLGSNAEMVEMIEMGSLDAMMLPQGAEAVYAPKMDVLGLPFLFKDYEEVYKVLDGPIGAELIDGLADRNMIQLAYWENGLRVISNSVRPINTPEDLKGLKIRTPEDALTISTFRALGASPSPMAFSEVYLALQQKTFDGQENPVANFHANNFQDVQKYISMTYHKYECKNMIFALTTWNKLQPDLQEILLTAAKIYGDEHRKAIVGNQDKMLEDVKAAGVLVNYPDTKPFQDMTASVYADFYKSHSWAKELVEKINAALGR